MTTINAAMPRIPSNANKRLFVVMTYPYNNEISSTSSKQCLAFYLESHVTNTTRKNNDFFSNLVFNIILPVVIMNYGAKPEYLGPMWAIAIALLFPLGYGIYELATSKKVNFLSVLGVISVLLTGGISLLKLPAEYIAIKEAAIPGLIGLAVVATRYVHQPLIKIMVLNDAVLNWDKLNLALAQTQQESAFAKSIYTANYILAGSFFLSSGLNYGLAKYILVSEPGTQAYTEELAKMTAMSYPVIVIPSMIIMVLAMVYIFKKMGQLTNQSAQSFLQQ